MFGNSARAAAVLCAAKNRFPFWIGWTRESSANHPEQHCAEEKGPIASKRHHLWGGLHVGETEGPCWSSTQRHPPDCAPLCAQTALRLLQLTVSASGESNLK